MRVSQLQRLTEHLYQIAQDEIADNRERVEEGKSTVPVPYLPVLVWGQAGIGKSETIKGVARFLGIGFKDLRLGQLEVGDLIGLPRQEAVYPSVYDVEDELRAGNVVKRYSRHALIRHLMQNHPKVVISAGGPQKALNIAIKRAEENYLQYITVKTVYATPDWFPDPGTHGILFLDEINRARRDVNQAIFQLILDREMHGLVLPRGWIIIAAANPPEEEGGIDDPGYQVQEMDKAFLDRFLNIILEVDVDEWLTYAADTHIDPSIRTVVAMSQGAALGAQGVKIANISPSPRAWVMLNRVMHGLPRDLVNDVAVGLVGHKMAVEWRNIVESKERPVFAKEILAGYDRPEVRGKLHRFMSWSGKILTGEYETVVDKETSEEKQVEKTTEQTHPRKDLIRYTFESLADKVDEVNSRGGSFTEAQMDNMGKFFIDALKKSADGGLGLRPMTMHYIKHKFARKIPKIFLQIPEIQGYIRKIREEAEGKEAVSHIGRSKHRRRGLPKPFSDEYGFSPDDPFDEIDELDEVEAIDFLFYTAYDDDPPDNLFRMPTRPSLAIAPWPHRMVPREMPGELTIEEWYAQGV